MKIWVDLDDTLVAFEHAVAMLGHAAGLPDDAPQEDKDAMFAAIVDAGPGFWANMPWRQDGLQLWEALKPYDPVLLSSPGRDGRFRTYAEKGKKIWVQKNIPGTVLFLDPDKEQFAERDSILIDNDQGNIDAWIERNGTGILYKDAASTIATLKQLIKENKVMSSRISITSSLRYTAAYMLFKTAIEEENFEDFLNEVETIKTPAQFTALVDALKAKHETAALNSLLNTYGPHGKNWLDENLDLTHPEKLHEIVNSLKERLPALIKIKRNLKPSEIPKS